MDIAILQSGNQLRKLISYCFEKAWVLAIQMAVQFAFLTSSKSLAGFRMAMAETIYWSHFHYEKVRKANYFNIQKRKL